MPRVELPAAALDPHSQRVRHVIGLEQQAVTRDETRAARRAYYGAVSYVDDQVGSLLAALEDAGFAANTVVYMRRGDLDALHRAVLDGEIPAVRRPRLNPRETALPGPDRTPGRRPNHTPLEPWRATYTVCN